MAELCLGWEGTVAVSPTWVKETETGLEAACIYLDGIILAMYDTKKSVRAFIKSQPTWRVLS